MHPTIPEDVLQGSLKSQIPPYPTVIAAPDGVKNQPEFWAALDQQLPRLERKEIAGQALGDKGRIIVVDSLEEAIDLANQTAFEHLELMIDDPWAQLPFVRHAGAIFLGGYTPEAAGDYLAGPNHVLPTMGTARFASALGVEVDAVRVGQAGQSGGGLRVDAEPERLPPVPRRVQGQVGARSDHRDVADDDRDKRRGARDHRVLVKRQLQKHPPGAYARDPRLRDLDCKLSYDDEAPFYRARVKLKREIVTLGVDGIDPDQAGTYVEPGDWNRLISDPDVTVIDIRNDYESDIGSFEHALQPNTASFREFPAYVSENLDPARQRRVAMFCTGGIRCEKATAFLRQQGFDEVYHLRGGILNYLERIPEADSLWRGECFVFDNRVSVNHALEKGSYDQCHACRRPVSAADKASPLYQPGVSCPACHDSKSDSARRRFRERTGRREWTRCRRSAW